MSRRQGYTKRVLEAQIRKYEKALMFDDTDLEEWLGEKFGSEDNCPICFHRTYLNTDCRADDSCEQCLAINVDSDTCSFQSWYQELKGIPAPARSRQIIKTRLKYWRKIYVTKYPEVKIWWVK